MSSEEGCKRSITNPDHRLTIPAFEDRKQKGPPRGSPFNISIAEFTLEQPTQTEGRLEVWSPA
jgi:hypothetical protein